MAAVDLLMSLKGSSDAGAVEAFKLGAADPNTERRRVDEPREVLRREVPGSTLVGPPGVARLLRARAHAAGGPRGESEGTRRRGAEVRAALSRAARGRAPARGGLRARGHQRVTLTLDAGRRSRRAFPILAYRRHPPPQHVTF